MSSGTNSSHAGSSEVTVTCTVRARASLFITSGVRAGGSGGATGTGRVVSRGGPHAASHASTIHSPRSLTPPMITGRLARQGGEQLVGFAGPVLVGQRVGRARVQQAEDR